MVRFGLDQERFLAHCRGWAERDSHGTNSAPATGKLGGPAAGARSAATRPDRTCPEISLTATEGTSGPVPGVSPLLASKPRLRTTVPSIF